MIPKRQAFLRCCEWIAKHFGREENQDSDAESEYFTDYFSYTTSDSETSESSSSESEESYSTEESELSESCDSE